MIALLAWVNFRRSLTAAPLKQALGGRWNAGSRGYFRRSLTAAPLKPGDEDGVGVDELGFPPFTNGGPIEAGVGAALGPSGWVFPPFTNGGPIEASWQVNSTCLVSDFRRSLTAAPLKRSRCR